MLLSKPHTKLMGYLRLSFILLFLSLIIPSLMNSHFHFIVLQFP